MGFGAGAVAEEREMDGARGVRGRAGGRAGEGTETFAAGEGAGASATVATSSIFTARPDFDVLGGGRCTAAAALVAGSAGFLAFFSPTSFFNRSASGT